MHVEVSVCGASVRTGVSVHMEVSAHVGASLHMEVFAVCVV